MTLPEPRPPWLPPGWSAALYAAVVALPRWVRANLPPGWWELPISALVALPEPQLLAIYRATRIAPLTEGRPVAAAMVAVYGATVRRLVRRYAASRLRSGARTLEARDQELLAQAWTAFFVAVADYDPARGARLATFAAYEVKEALIAQLISALPQPPHSDDTRKAWERTLACWAQLAQERGHAPRPEEVAEVLAPQLLPAIPTLQRAQRAILDVFRVLIDNKVPLDEPEDGADEHVSLAQPADNTWNPQQLLDDQAQRQAARAVMDRRFTEVVSGLGYPEAAGKLLALRLLLNVKEGPRGQPVDYGMYKIKEFINEPAPEIAEHWLALWLDYDLARYALPQSWDDLRALFDPPTTVADLRQFYRYALAASGWDQPLTQT